MSLIVSAVDAIPNTGPADWEAWNRTGMALWAATGGSQEGWEAFDSWSAYNNAYDAKATHARWDHYAKSPPNKIGAGTIFRMAMEAGWSDPRRPPPPNGEDDYGKTTSKPSRDTSNGEARPTDSAAAIHHAGSPHPSTKADKAQKQHTHAQRALEMLTDLCAEAGRVGFTGEPPGFATVSAESWRDRFYQGAMPGADKDTKKHAFARAVKTLIGQHKVGRANDRVWINRGDGNSGQGPDGLASEPAEDEAPEEPPPPEIDDPAYHKAVDDAAIEARQRSPHQRRRPQEDTAFAWPTPLDFLADPNGEAPELTPRTHPTRDQRLRFRQRRTHGRRPNLRCPRVHRVLRLRGIR